MYVGPPIDDFEILDRLPPEYRNLLEQANGYIAYHGGLHVRGACLAPAWHSLRAAWFGDRAVNRLFSVLATLALSWEIISPADLAKETFDEEHSDDEDRFISIGPIRRGLVLVVWTERDEHVVRIISARWATRREASLYRAHVRRLT